MLLLLQHLRLYLPFSAVKRLILQILVVNVLISHLAVPAAAAISTVGLLEDVRVLSFLMRGLRAVLVEYFAHL